MSLQERRAHIHQLVDATTSEEVLSRVEVALLPVSTTTEDEQARYDAARQQYREGKFYTKDELFALMDEQLKARGWRA